MSGNTTRLRGWLQRIQAGDESAFEELMGRYEQHLRGLAHRMLHSGGNLSRWEQTDDIFQGALLRLSRAIRVVIVEDSAHFSRLASLQIRRELIDLAWRNRHLVGESRGPIEISEGGTPRPREASDNPDWVDDPANLTLWAIFHEEVERLPEELREVFDHRFYLGESVKETAATLGISERTVKRQYRAGRCRLHDAIHGQASASVN